MSLYRNIQLPGHPDPENVRKLDILAIPQTLRMSKVGIAVDREWLWELVERLTVQKGEHRQQVANYIPADRLDEFVSASNSGDEIGINVDSPEQISKLLFDMLGVGENKRLRRTKKGDRVSTGKKQMQALKYDHPVVPLILQYRECSKLISSFCAKWPKISRFHNEGVCKDCGRKHLGDHWRLHPRISTTRTVPGRLAIKDGLHQIPARTKLGAEVRKAFIPSPGHKLISCDWSGLHLRLLAWFADEQSMLKIFRANGDIHLSTAMNSMGITDPAKVDKMMHRAPAKTTNFLVVNQGGSDALFDTLVMNFALSGHPCPDWLTNEWCENYMVTWHGLYPGVQGYFDKMNHRAKRYEMNWCMFGRVRRIPEVRSIHERVRAAGLRQGGNHPLIGTEAGMARLTMTGVEDQLEVWRESGVSAEALLPMHDELVLEAEEKWADEVCGLVKVEMETVLDDKATGKSYSRCPITADGHTMERWVKD